MVERKCWVLRKLLLGSEAGTPLGALAFYTTGGVAHFVRSTTGYGLASLRLARRDFLSDRARPRGGSGLADHAWSLEGLIALLQ